MFIVRWHPEAVTDFETVRGRDDRRATFNVVDKLFRTGDQLAPPHAKKLTGESDWCELRPSSGRSHIRPIYRRERDEFVIYTVAVAQDKADFATALARATQRRAADEAARPDAPAPPRAVPGRRSRKRQ